MTRANIYLYGDTFIGEIGGDAYPDGDVWRLLVQMDTEKLTAAQFKKEIRGFILQCYGEEYLPPDPAGVGNWSYEYTWVPTEAPKTHNRSTKRGEEKYWRDWTGRIYVRRPVSHSRLYAYGDCYVQLPDRWYHLSQYKQMEGAADR